MISSPAAQGTWTGLFLISGGWLRRPGCLCWTDVAARYVFRGTGLGKPIVCSTKMALIPCLQQNSSASRLVFNLVLVNTRTNWKRKKNIFTHSFSGGKRKKPKKA